MITTKFQEFKNEKNLMDVVDNKYYLINTILSLT